MAIAPGAWGNNTTLQKLEHVFLGKRVPVPAIPGIRSATVVSATASAVVVTIVGFDAQATFTCRYEPRFNDAEPGRSQVTPPAGTACVVAFSGNDISDGWVLAFAAWPTP